MLGTRQLKKIFSGVVQKPPPAVTLPIASNKLSTPWNCTTQKILLLVNSYFTLSRSLEKAGLFCVFHQSQQGIKLESFASWETWPHWWTPSGVLWADFKTLSSITTLSKSYLVDQPIRSYCYWLFHAPNETVHWLKSLPFLWLKSTRFANVLFHPGVFRM